MENSLKQNYVLGSHNSWSYLPPLHWWMWPFKFMAKCQSKTIKEQYELGVRCFDLRLLFDAKLIGSCTDKRVMFIAHGFMKYRCSSQELHDTLDWLNSKGDCYVRILHEARRKSQYTISSKMAFQMICRGLKRVYPNIKWWCGRNLYNWDFDYDFGPEPSCEENYSSVMPPKWLDDWWPWLYSKLNNKKILAKGTDKEILLIDFVNIR